MLNLIARDQATTDRWARADATYREAIELARESGQQTELAFGVAGLAWLLGAARPRATSAGRTRRRPSAQRRAGSAAAVLWATTALGELELATGAPERAAERFGALQALLRDFAITDVDLSPVPELVDALVRTGRREEAAAPVAALLAAAEAKGQPWSLARALRARGLVAGRRPRRRASTTRWSCTRGRPTPSRRRGRGWPTASACAAPASAGAPASSCARRWTPSSGSTPRPGPSARARSSPRRARRCGAATPARVEELTPQELQIALLLAAGRTTREAAAALFLSPKTIEYHLRNVYRKLDIHSREELAVAAVADGHAAG